MSLYSSCIVYIGFLLDRKLENFHRDDAARVCLITHALQSTMYVVATGRLALLLGRGLACTRSSRLAWYTRTIIIIGAVEAEYAICIRVIDKYCGRIRLGIIIRHAVKSIIVEAFLQILSL